ncbi:MAG: hypothetical protein ACM3JI_03600, partial [Anaerolineae bacterium]
PQGILCQVIVHADRSRDQSVTLKDKGKALESNLFKNSFQLPLLENEEECVHPIERLSLGMHKSQEWDMVCRRQDLKEIFPLWFRLGQWLPRIEKPVFAAGTLRLLDECQEKIFRLAKNELWECFFKLFKAGFYGLMVPRLKDEQFQGLVFDDELPSEGIPLSLLTEGSSLIRSLFIQESSNRLALLPCLLPQFHSGRFVNLSCFKEDMIDIEWSKKVLRRVIWRSFSKKTVELVLQKDIKTFRVRRSMSEHGEILLRSASLMMERGEILFLDRFQK